MQNFWEKVAVISQIVAYILAVIVVIQILRLIFGGSWTVEEVVLAILVLNLTLTFGMFGYLIHVNNELGNKISNLDKKITSHVAWHRGRDSR